MLDVENDLERIILPGREKIDYYNDYNQLINQCLPRGLNKNKVPFYTEKHHIYPRCLGGEDINSNYVLLSSLEHIVAHILLYRSYPNNIKLLRACSAEIYMTKGDPESMLRINEVRELAKRREIFGTPIVCYDEEFNVIRLYNSTSLCKDDGFHPSTISYVLGGVYKTSGGYYWSELEDFEEQYPEKLEYFLGLEESDWPPLKEKKERVITGSVDLSFRKTNKAIVQTDKSRNIIKIYRAKYDVILDSLCKNYIDKALIEKTEYHGYWYSLEEFSVSYPEKLEEFIENLDNNALTTFSIDTGNYTNNKHNINFIICHDKEYNIYRMFSTLYATKLKGFSIGAVSSALNLGNRTNNTNYYKGYYWTRLSDWTREDKLREYELLEIENRLPELKIKSFKTKIVRCKDTKGTIETIFSSLGQAREFGIHHQNLYRRMKSDKNKGKHSLYNGSYWYEYDEFKSLFPDQLKEFESKNKILNY